MGVKAQITGEAYDEVQKKAKSEYPPPRAFIIEIEQHHEGWFGG